MVRRLSGLLLGWLIVACGDKGPAPGAGSGGDAGSATAMAGSGGVAGAGSLGGSLSGGSGGGGESSSAGGVADKARGAFSFHVETGPGCLLEEQWVDFPVVEGGHPVTATEAVQLIADGATMQVTNSSGKLIDTTVSRLTCRWVSDPAVDLHVGFRFGVAGQEGTLSMTPTTKVGAPRTWGFVLLDATWDEKTYGGQCTYTTHEANVATRSLRGEVSCPILDRVTGMPVTDPVEQCALTGYYAFENCTYEDISQ